MLIALAILGALLIAGVLFLRVAGGGRFPWISFYAKGREAGFTFREIGLLRRENVDSYIRRFIEILRDRHRKSLRVRHGGDAGTVKPVFDSEL